MNSENACASLEIGKINSDLSIETSRTKKCLIKNISTICSCNSDNSGVSIETVHLYKKLVNGLLTLVISSSKSCATLTSNCINLVNENNTGGVLLSLGENITYTRSSNSDKHLYELGSRDGDEGNSSFSSNSLCEKGLTGTGRSIKDNSTRNTASVSIVKLRLLEEINNLNKLKLCSIASCNIVEVNSGIGDHLNLSLCLSESHGVLSSSSHSSGHLTSSSATAGKEEKSCKESSRKDEALCKISESSSTLVSRKHGYINLNQIVKMRNMSKMLS